MDIINDLFKQLSGIQTEALFAVALYITGFVVKRIPQVPNWVIPIGLVFVLGPLGGYFILNNPGQADPAIRNPEVRSVLLGMTVAAIICFFHDKIGRYVENILPSFLKPEPNKDTNEKNTTPPAANG